MSLSVENLSFAYGAVPVLRDVSFTAEGGELVSVLGPNGVGKTTLFRCILGTLTPQTGHIKMDGQDLATLPPRERARRIAYIPQIHPPTFGYTVLDTVLIWLNTPEASSRSKIHGQVIRPTPIRMMTMVMSRSAQRGSRLRRRLGFG